MVRIDSLKEEDVEDVEKYKELTFYADMWTAQVDLVSQLENGSWATGSTHRKKTIIKIVEMMNELVEDENTKILSLN